jgi:predicted chitinase
MELSEYDTSNIGEFTAAWNGKINMSKAMKALQERCGVAPDGAFGPNTAKAISRHYELSPERAAHLLGQSAHESGYFKLTEENLNYSEGALNRVFGRYFGEGKEDASKCA